MLADDAIFAGRYRIVRRLAAGGMGAVYAARHLETDRACALKIMLPHVAESEAMRERFRREARAAALISSTHVVEVLDAGVDEATKSPFMVMELLVGEDLGQRVARLGHLSPGEVAVLLGQAARGLDALHRASIVHRDLKPSNLFLAEREGEAPRVKVLDLGVAKRVADTAGTTATVGTPLYMAPEQFDGDVSPATDVYALGMVAYSLLVGREYWAPEADAAKSTIGFALEMINGPKAPATARAAELGIHLPEAFDAWFFRAAARDAAARFPSAIAAADALVSALGVDGEAVLAPHLRPSEQPEQVNPEAPTVAEPSAPPVGAPTRTLPGEEGSSAPNPKRARRRPGRWMAAAAAALVIACGSWVALKRTKARAPEGLVQAIACAAADATGKDATDELRGAGACARLGVELGVPWNEPGGARLEVRAELGGEGQARVKLAIAGQTAEGEGKTPILATEAAVAAIAERLAVPPMAPERVHVWGAKDEAGARRLARAVQRAAFGFTANPRSEAESLLQTDPESPVAHVLAACTRQRVGDAGAIAAKKEALDRLSAVPDGHAHLLHGILRTYVHGGEESEPVDGPKLLLQSYDELAEDPDFASLYTFCGCIETDKSLPMADWIAERWPAAGLPILGCTFAQASEDPERQARYVRWMHDVLPEMLGTRVRGLLEMGRIDEARTAASLSRILGHKWASRGQGALDRALIALTSFDGRGALKAAEEVHGDPDPSYAREGARLRIQALLVAGRMKHALNAYEVESGLVPSSEPGEAAVLAASELRLRRLLRLAPVSAGRLAKLDFLAARALERHASEGQRLRMEIVLARAGGTPETAREALGKLLPDDEDSAVGVWAREFQSASRLPALRIGSGDEAAAAKFRELSLRDARRFVALEAGLALEAIGATADAEKAYRLCLVQPFFYAFDNLAARARLAVLLRKAGREEEARAFEVVVAEAWAGADEGLRDAIERMK
jgi:eukaryotic-like serine/threonine-protein kinase